MKSYFIKWLALVIGICSLAVLIIPILIYEAITDLKWKAGNNERN